MTEHAATVAPDVYKVVFENDRIRVLEARMPVGARTEMHSHPDYLVYALQDGKVKFTAPSGETGEVEIKAGDVMWREAEEHATDNVGQTEVHALFVEPK
jgi:quercetin dioxygenase-like cupin family protein